MVRGIMMISSVCASSLLASEAVLESMVIETEATTLFDIRGKEVKSADLAEALYRKVPSISLVRRSGIANDIILRGQKRDNINVLVDGAKIYGACPNRMDPPTSHVVTENIDKVTVIEGPYDVENFGTLSGLVQVKTSESPKELSGKVGVNAGSYGYLRASAVAGGGNDTVRALVSASTEKSNQYRDGDGNTFADQIDQAIANGQAAGGNAYQPKYRDMNAYMKRSFKGKLFVDVAENQQLRTSYTLNRSENILYPNTPMDAIYDDADLFNFEYSLASLGSWSKALDLKYYYSTVDHPMSTQYRNAAIAMNAVIKNHLESTIQGGSIKNKTALTDSLDMTVGLDGSWRNWDGKYYRNDVVMSALASGGASINDATTRNAALFLLFEQQYNDMTMQLGLRYDDTEITSGDATQQDNSYQSFNGYLYATYQPVEAFKFFGGVGKSSRVPDGRELYFYKSNAVMVGTPDLDQTTNYQADIGVQNSYKTFNWRTRAFYSRLRNYIYFNSDKSEHNFENIDATIWGFDFAGTWHLHEQFFVDAGLAYQRGKKDDPLEDQTNTNLADIPPLKGNLALNYVYSGANTATLELVAADKWSDFDDDNGEQELDGWSTLNIKIDHRFENGVGLTVGVDNLFNETYAVSNTYKDLTLLSIPTADEVMLMNESGRYFYANLRYTF